MKLIHKVIANCDAFAICGVTARNDNKTPRWTECNCIDCLKFRRVLRENKLKPKKKWL